MVMQEKLGVSNEQLKKTGEIILGEWQFDLNVTRQMAELFIHDPNLSLMFKKRADYLEELLTHGILFQRTLSEPDIQQYYETLGDAEIP